MTKKLLCFLAIVLALFILFLGIHYVTSIDLNNENEVLLQLCKKEESETIKLFKISIAERYGAVLYECNAQTKLIVYEKDIVFKRFLVFGGASYSSGIQTFNTTFAGKDLLMIVFGHNPLHTAHSYEFFINEEKFSRDNLDEYILDIYDLKGRNNTYSDGKAYDQKHEYLFPF